MYLIVSPFEMTNDALITRHSLVEGENRSPSARKSFTPESLIMSSTLITNALIVPMTERRSFNGYVRIENSTIAAVDSGAPPEVLPDQQVIDAAGAVLLPGLVNAHTHLYQVLLRALWEDLELMPWLRRIYGCARVLRPEHFYAGSLLGCVEGLRSGVTTLCEHNFLNPNPDCAFETMKR